MNFVFENIEDRMIKNLEMGVMLPSEFIIDNKSDLINYFVATKENQTIRFIHPFFQARAKIEWEKILITPIIKKNFKSSVYVKAENILATFFTIDFNIVKSKYENIKFKILDASYGSSKYVNNVIEKIIAKVHNDKITLTVSNELFGDPHVGVKKKLFIHYVDNGLEKNFEAYEGTEIILP